MDDQVVDLQRQIESWQAEVDRLVGEEFTAERSRRVDELDRLISAAWEKLDPMASRDGGEG